MVVVTLTLIFYTLRAEAQAITALRIRDATVSLIDEWHAALN